MNSPPLGAVLAGGESSRYGSPKALATVGGVRIIDRVIRALREVTPEIILSANEPALFRDLGLPAYPDERPGLGPLGGIYTTLLRAREAGRPGILAVACDMPFPSAELLAVLGRRAFGWGRGPGPKPAGDSYPGRSSSSATGADSRAAPGSATSPDILLPGSGGPRGVEPLFAAYRTTCIAAIEAALAEGDRRMIGFHDRVAVHTIPIDEVESLCDPATAFLNVNTTEDRDRAESMVERGEGGA